MAFGDPRIVPMVGAEQFRGPDLNVLAGLIPLGADVKGLC